MSAKAIILAAGQGTRMKSEKPKVIHEILGKPLIRYVVDAARQGGVDEAVCVLGYGIDQVKPLVEDATVVLQEQQLGTGHAVLCAREAFLQDDGTVAPGSVVVLSGDCPLINGPMIAGLVRFREENDAAAVVLTTMLDQPFGYGRIVRGADDEVLRIVEEKDATDEERSIKEVNTGMYCFDAQALFAALEGLSNENAQGEYYLTDVLEICRTQGRSVLALYGMPEYTAGINSRKQLAEATKVMQRRINEEHMANGVTMWDPDQVWIGPDVEIEPDVELLPQTYLLGATKVGRDSVIGPNTRLTDTVVGRGCRVDETVAIEAQLDDKATAGPRAYLRPQAHLCEGAKAGTHVEIKKSTIGKGSKVPHLSYIGDTTMGEGVNIGAGSITCNYDGVMKNKTFIGDNVFVGSDTMMVAPVSIGEGAIIGAASCITRDVAPDALALERNEQKEIPNWAAKHMAKLRRIKAERDAEQGK